MSIVKCDFNKSEELEKEIHSTALSDESFKEATKFSTPKEFIDSWIFTQHKNEVIDTLASFKPGSRILDIGAGFGHTSLLFASHGHQVTVVEPSYDYCKVIEALAEKFSFNLKIYHSTMEDLKTEDHFDYCVFNASLHHCDDPVIAIQNCFSLLSPGGKIFLINEPVLKFYRSKEWYDRIRITNPEAVGDYGGNEHIYRYYEYKDMLMNSGFVNISEKIPIHFSISRETVQPYLVAKTNSNYRYSSLNVLARWTWYTFLSRMTKIEPVLKMLKSLSLISCTFSGTKPVPKSPKN